MVFCPQCGVQNPAAARYCDQCGAALVPVVRPATAMPAPVGTQQAARVPVQAVPMTTGNTCPQCGVTFIPGEAFCDSCGAALTVGMQHTASVPVPAPVYVPASAPPAATPVVPQQAASVPVPAAPPVTPIVQRAMLAPAQLEVAGVMLPLPASPQALIGRSDAVSQFFPDVDLGSHGAIEGGVGRRHTRIFLDAGELKIEDLDSTNGTALNGRRLAPRAPELLRDGDEIRLGTLSTRFRAG